MTTVLAVLEEADRVLSSPDKWIKGDLAKDENGDRVAASDPAAACFCLSGAVVNAYARKRDKYLSFDPIITMVRFAINKSIIAKIGYCGLSPIPTYNDDPSTTFEDVKDVLSQAIEAEKAKIEA